MNEKVEFIESYIKTGSDYQWNDNHGYLIRCKDCKHYGKGSNENRYAIVWPDDVCPCQCGDSYYNWLPPEDWYCANGERKDGEQDAID